MGGFGKAFLHVDWGVQEIWMEISGGKKGIEFEGKESNGGFIGAAEE